MAEQPSRRPSGSRRGRPSLLGSITGAFKTAWYGLTYYLLWPFRALRESSERKKRRAAAPSETATTGQTARYFLLLPFRTLGSAYRQTTSIFRGWSRSTSIKYLIQSLPAVLISIAALTMTGFAYFKSNERVIEDYQRAGTTAIENKDYATARICYFKLLTLLGARPEILYYLAISEDEIEKEKIAKDKNYKGDPERTLALMEKVSPEDQTIGMWEAQLWKAKKYYAIDPPTPQTLERSAVNFYRVLYRAKNANSNIPPSAVQEASAGLYDIFMKTGQIGQAQELLANARFKKPELQVAYLRALVNSNPDEVRRELPKIRDDYIKLLNENPKDVTIRLALADTYRIMDDFNSAAQTLEAGLKQQPTDAQKTELQTALANLYTIQLQVLSAQKKIDTNGQLRLVQSVLEYDPANIFILQRLYTMAEGEDKEMAAKARDLIGKVIAKGPQETVVPTFQFVQGNYWFGKGQSEKARGFLDKAYKLNPNISELANNYAFIIATSPPVELEKALKIIDVVIQNSPNVVQYYDTRGIILTRLGRYKEALLDLELALREMPTSRTVHKALETCYRGLQMPEIADEHARIADRLTEEISRRRMEQVNQRLLQQPAVDPPAPQENK